MEASAFLEKHGRQTAERVAKLAGTNFAYFSQIASGHRRPSPDLARRLVSSSAAIVRKPAEQLDFESLLPPKREARAA
jgi:transcriptional regulator with XRE-family HTH domain